MTPSIADLSPVEPSSRSWIDAIARVLVHALLARCRMGSVVVVEHGRSSALGHGPVVAEVVVHDPRLYRALLLRTSAGLGEAYVAGWFDVDDLTAFVRFALANLRPALSKLDTVARWLEPLRSLRRRQPRSKATAKADIQAHYDLGNDFYARMLDETMLYSCALFPSPEASLHEAQLAKLARLCERLDLQRDDHLLEIGTGWGGLAIYAASTIGCRVTSVTISPAQYEFATDKVRALGLEDRVTILEQDYRDLEGTFDKVVSVEMVEAIGFEDFPVFFERCRSLVRDDGLVVIQAITMNDASYDRAKRRTDFIKSMVFPGGCLPSLGVMVACAEAVGLSVRSVEDLGLHYAETLRRWRTNLVGQEADLDAMGLDARFRRLWAMYLGYCEAAFEERHISDVHLTLVGSARPLGTA